MIYYIDGYSNKKACGYLIIDEDNKRIHRIIETGKRYTCNECEYMAMVHALEMVKDNDTIFSDSQLVVYQTKGLYRCKAKNLERYYTYCKRKYDKMNINIQWIPREQNKAGILIDNKFSLVAS